MTAAIRTENGKSLFYDNSWYKICGKVNTIYYNRKNKSSK